MKKAKELPPLEVLQDLFDFDEKTGKLFWKVRPSRRTKKGDEAGYVKPDGYRKVRLKGKTYYTHRILFSLYHGELVTPDWEIDHIDRDKSNNRKENLRIVTRQENGRNRCLSSNNTSGHRGVSWFKKSKKWIVQMTINGKQKHLGLFTSKDDAIAARLQAEKTHGFFPQ